MRVVAWDFLFYALLGIVIVFAVRIGGVVVVFAFLIIPATLSALYATGLRARLLLCWSTGVAGALLGLLFADRLDFSVGPSVALLLGAELVAATLLRKARRGVAASVGAVATVLCILLLLAIPSGRQRPGAARAGSGPKPDTAPPAALREPPAQDAETVTDESVTAAASGRELVELFERAPDMECRYRIVQRALEVEPRAGARLSLRLLETDPPPFFRQVVMSGLDGLTDTPPGFDPSQPFASEANQSAARALRAELGLEGE
jgi:hypothetical protein